MIRLHCPACSTTWVAEPEVIDDRVEHITEHTVTAHGWSPDAARFDVRGTNAAAIDQARAELARA